MGPAVASVGGFLYEAGGYSTTAIKSRIVPGTKGNSPARPANLNAPDVYNNTVARTNGAGGWTALAPMLNPEFDGPGVSDGTKFYVLGGYDSSGSVATTNQIYDPVANTWSMGAPIPLGESGAAAAYYNGKIYLFGGCNDGTCGAPRSDLQIYTISTNTWSTGAPIPGGSTFGAAKTIGSFIYFATGIDGTSNASVKTYRYDPTAGTWDDAAMADVPETWWGAASSVLGGKMFMYGGVTNGFNTVTNRTKVFDPVANTWSEDALMSTASYRMQGDNLNNNLYVVGGSTGGFTETSRVEKYTGSGCGAPTATPTACAAGYSYSTTTGATVVPGTTDTGNHGDDVLTTIALPFSYQLYDTVYSSAQAASNGALFFGTANGTFSITCIPNTLGTYVIAPYWGDQCTGPCFNTTCTGCGIFTSISGTAPNRIFNIEWRTNYYGLAGQSTALLNYEVRLYEGQTNYDVVYGNIVAATVANDSQLTVGVQKNPTLYTSEGCDTTGGTVPPVSTGQRYAWTLGSCGTASPTPPAGTATRTATAGSATPTCAAGGTPGPWTVVSPVPTARYGVSGAGDSTNYYAIGGDTLGATIGDVERYDPTANSWTAMAPIPTPVLDSRVVDVEAKCTYSAAGRPQQRRLQHHPNLRHRHQHLEPGSCHAGRAHG